MCLGHPGCWTAGTCPAHNGWVGVCFYMHAVYMQRLQAVQTRAVANDDDDELRGNRGHVEEM